MPKFEKYLIYKPRKGVLIWFKTPPHAYYIKVGDQAGFIQQNGYRYIRLKLKYYLAHRVCWYLKTGRWPETSLDHRDGNKDNNKWKNLRLATSSQNQMNRKRSNRNTSGYKGASWHSGYKRWYAMINIGGTPTWLGSYKTAQGAHAAYIKAAKKHFGEFARAH